MQQRVVRERLLLLHASNTKSRPMRRQTPLAYAAAAAAAVMFACSLVGAAVAQEVGIKVTLGASSLSVARSNLAATSLPNHGIVIFAGGVCGTFSFECAQDALLFRRVCEAQGGVYIWPFVLALLPAQRSLAAQSGHPMPWTSST
jgi:hypothetical protein